MYLIQINSFNVSWKNQKAKTRNQNGKLNTKYLLSQEEVTCTDTFSVIFFIVQSFNYEVLVY